MGHEPHNLDNIPALMQEMGDKARRAARHLARADSTKKNAALRHAAERIRAATADILNANNRDMEAGRHKGLSDALLDRLALNEERVEGLASALEAIADQEDPIGQVLAQWQRPNGLDIARVAVPLGVIGVIYESRPGVTVDAAALCVKAGNAVILRGGSEAKHSNRLLADITASAMTEAGLDGNAVQLVPTQDRAAVGTLLTTPGLVDVLVPRGGKSLVARVEAEARVPVFAHLDGICHLFLDREADPKLAREVIVNAKMRRPGICGALETLLVDEGAVSMLPDILHALKERGCAIRGDAGVMAIDADVEPATDEDWSTEYLDAILSVRIVSGLDAAIDHIAQFSSHHTDGILTENTEQAEAFLEAVDSAIIMVNTSTQFADGGEFGMGAEIGIATGRFHARGPVGAAQLTTYKYMVRGTGQVRP